MPAIAPKKKGPPKLPAGKPAASPSAVPAVPAEDESSRKTIFQTLGVCATSLALHAVVFLIMEFVILGVPDNVPLLGILSSLPEPEKQKIDFTNVKIDNPEEVLEQEQAAEIVVKVTKKSDDRFEVDIDDLLPSASLAVDPNASAPTAVAPPKGHFGGRSKAGRSALVAKYGGNKNSEAAVRRGLEWLKRHQLPDGSWSFDHRVRGCNCGNPGSFGRTKMGATAMALLCYLGAGHTFLGGRFPAPRRTGVALSAEKRESDSPGLRPAGNRPRQLRVVRAGARYDRPV